VAVGDGEYPPDLLNLSDPPGWLFVRGRTLQSGPAVAVVGARRCSAYGREVAGWVGRGVAAAGVTVVSGAARGIDAAAHRGALAGGGPTVAVLGSGIDVAYPSGNTRLIQAIAREGAVVSEYPPGTPAGRYRFPARNRIVVALSRAVVVVEGAPGSGSTISAGFAEQLGRDVLAVPGPVTSPLSMVPHDLIRDGAGLVRGPGDVLEVLGKPGPVAADDLLESLTAEQRRVFDALAGEPVTADAVAAGCGLPVPRTLGALMALELRGLIQSSGGRYVRAAITAGS
jgi:DNA processing protein